MLTLLAVSVALALVRAAEEIPLDVMLVDYDGMYNTECAKTTSAPSTTSSTAYAYQHGWEQYSDKYQGSNSAASVKGNKISANDDADSQSKQNKVFCKCLEEEKKAGKSYADSQNAFSKCIDKSNGNDASHWKSVSSQYAHKYHVKVVPNADKSASADTKSETDPEINDVATVEDVQKESELETAEVESEVEPEAEPEAEAEMKPDEESHGNTAVFVTFIGASVLLLICGWFIKGSLKNWKHGNEYDHIKVNPNVRSYQAGDNADANKSYNGWNQYSTV